MKYMLGIDVGSQSIRVCLFNIHGQEVCMRTLEQYIEVEKPLWATQKASFWWPAISQAIQEIIAEKNMNPRNIASVACCAHMHGAVPVDKEGNLLVEDIQMYLDKRTMDIVDRLKRQKNADELYQISGNMPASNWAGLKLKWIKEHQPDVYEKTYKLLMPKDYINYKLTGIMCTDPTEASGFLLMDVETNTWSDALIEGVGVDKDKLPNIIDSFEVMGTITAKAAKETGLAAGTKVAAGCGDMAASMYSCGVHNKGVGIDLMGTTGVMACYAEKPLLDKRLLNIRAPMYGWLPYGTSDAAGADYRWFRDTLAKEESAKARAAGVDPYDYLSALAEKVAAGANGLLFLPHFLGERTLGDVNTRGAYVGLHLGADEGHMVRALLEGVAFDLKRTVDLIEENGIELDVIYHVSGGAKSKLWSQIKADIYQKPVCTLAGGEDSVLGVAYTGGVAVGLFATPEEALNTTLKIDKTYEPNPKNKQVYDDMYGIFDETHSRLQDVFLQLSKHY